MQTATVCDSSDAEGRQAIHIGALCSGEGSRTRYLSAA